VLAASSVVVLGGEQCSGSATTPRASPSAPTMTTVHSPSRRATVVVTAAKVR
jgi:hypothetical protein